VIRERKLVAVPNISATFHDQKGMFRALGHGFATYHGTPVWVKGEPSGVLEVFHRQPFQPDDDWQNFFETLVGQAAIALENAMLFNNLKERNLQLEEAYDHTLEGWAHMLEMRDRETEGHTRRVVDLTLRLARVMGMSEAELVNVRRGALMHDIGKMAIPDEILLKEGPLTGDEWEVMRRHPEYAYRVLGEIDYLKPALAIPYYHHERWDGGGYPHGLKGKEIPLPARIFAIVDVWDALSCERPYHRPMAKAEVMEHIRGEAGKQFDPRLVEEFLKLVEG
jgi:HD-GYP domain-containing protein (c-di-GMP phosphodiesterase class II)